MPAYFTDYTFELIKRNKEAIDENSTSQPIIPLFLYVFLDSKPHILGRTIELNELYMDPKGDSDMYREK